MIKTEGCIELFIQTALRSKSVIVCRSDPKQKAQLTKMVKERGNIVCSVGDGGNDVGMIIESSIGIGIEGLEGRQAALASDVSIAQLDQLN